MTVMLNLRCPLVVYMIARVKPNCVALFPLFNCNNTLELRDLTIEAVLHHSVQFGLPEKGVEKSPM